jgi:type VI secretion system protein ImpA
MYQLDPINTDQPCGDPNIEYSGEFIAFRDEFSLLDGGDNRTKLGGVWSAVHDRGLKLLGVSRHVRLYYFLGLSELLTRGLAGFAELLNTLALACETQWADLHPQADPDDPDDLIDRVIALEEFAGSLVLQRLIREQILGTDRLLGTFRVRDVLVAENRFTLTENSEPTLPRADCEQILSAMKPEMLDSLHKHLASLIDSTVRIQVAAQNGVPNASINLSALLNVLQTVEMFVRPFCQSDAAVASAEALHDAAADLPTAGTAIQQAPVAAGRALAVNGPQDVIKVLDLVIKYYQDNEPSSPVPYLIRRAKRLVSVDFIALVRDLSPDSLHAMKTLFGIENESD